MLRIERSLQVKPVVRLIGRMQADQLPGLEHYLETPAFKPVLDLQEVTLVDVEAVRFLIGCENRGFELLHCSPYIREWMDREQSDHG